MIPLRPGDVLLYNRNGFFNRIIRVKTWSRISHVEVVLDGISAVASRNGIGVGRYPIDRKGLDTVLRPRRFDVNAAYRWFETVEGQGYDWLGMLSFTSAKFQGKENGKMFCSEFATRFMRAGGVDPFNGYDADGIAPGEFCKSPLLRTVWREKK